MSNWTRKIWGIIIVGVSLLTIPSRVYASNDLYNLTRQAGYTVTAADTPKASVVIDAESGSVLWNDNGDTVKPIASLTKLMTAYLTFEAIQKGEFSFNTTITATPEHQAISQLIELSNTTIISGERYTVHDLMLMTLISSSNVASIMLAEKVSNGDLSAFVAKMNAKAQQLGLTQTQFTDPSGATFESYTTAMRVPIENRSIESSSTAKELAILAARFLQDYPDVLTYTNKVSVTVGQQTAYPETLWATNFSVVGATHGAEGVDGLKTGSSPNAGYNYIATAKRGNFRVIEVILGSSTFDNTQGKYIRHYFGNALLEHIFSAYEKRELLAAGQHTIDNTEISVSQVVVGIGEKGVANTYQLTENQVTISPNYKNLLGKTPYTVPIVNVTQQKEEARRLEEERQTKLIVIGVVVAVSIIFAIALMLRLRKPKVKARRRRRR